jgi:hypothetical protein
MRYIKLIACLTLLNVIAVASFAQLSDRVNNPSKFKTGTRPIAGNMGFYLGISSEDIKTWLAKEDSTTQDSTEEVIKSIIPLVSLKYYINDDLVFRIGIKASKEKTVRDGKIDPAVNGGNLTSKTDIRVTSETYFSPAIEKHFLNSNLLDAYVVGTLPIGYIKEKVVDSWHNDLGDFQESTMTKNSLAYGLEGHIGLQAFIADLPLALGLELGISGIGYRGEKYKNVVNSSIGGVTTDQKYYTWKDDPQNLKYSSLKSNSFDTNGSIRLTLSYYFSK